jgi:hypothetical protein
MILLSIRRLRMNYVEVSPGDGLECLERAEQKVILQQQLGYPEHSLRSRRVSRLLDDFQLILA